MIFPSHAFGKTLHSALVCCMFLFLTEQTKYYGVACWSSGMILALGVSLTPG